MKSGSDDAVPFLKALILLQLAALREQGASVKPEVLLHRAGIEMTDIAEMLDKKYPAIAKTISRARAAPRERDQ